MSNPVLIIHGWSDDSSNFKELGQYLKSKLNKSIKYISLADWISLNDQITFKDLALALEKEFSRAFWKTPKSVDIIAHSAGSLVVREWLTTYYTPETSPIKRLVLLAPASFGSQLAHKGKSFIGRAIKGWGSTFQTGVNLLDDLELASPYTFNLASKDILKSWYEPGGILPTVFTGNSKLTLFIDEPGSDGVVRESCANLNLGYMKADFSVDPKTPNISFRSNKPIAFGIIDGANHSSIINLFKVSDLILQALSVDDNNYYEWTKRLSVLTNKGKDDYCNLITRVRDHLGFQIDDYFIEFYSNHQSSGDEFCKMFYSKIVKTVHAYKKNQSYRSIYINSSNLAKENKPPFMNISLTAQPEAKNNIYGYETNEDNDIGSIFVPFANINQYFPPNQTIILDMIIKRVVSDKAFKISYV